MHYKSMDDVTVRQNSPSCVVSEFGNISTIDGADIVIDGRYPEVGFAMNETSDMVARILSGEGRVVTKESKTIVKPGDVVFVEKQEVYYFEGSKLKLFMACTPAWSSEQSSKVE